MKKNLFAALCVFSVLLLAACGAAAPRLDREVALGPITYSVSSEWPETDQSGDEFLAYDYKLDDGGTAESDDDVLLEVMVSTSDHGYLSEDRFQAWLESIESAGADVTITQETVIDGAKATRYAAVYEGNDGAQHTRYGLYISRGDFAAQIECLNLDEATANAVLDSVHPS